MRPDDEGGGGTDAGGGDGAPAAEMEAYMSFTSLLEHFPSQLLPGDEEGACGGGDSGTAAAGTRDSEDLFSFNG